MKELADINTLYARLQREGGSGILATVVKTSGSTYRRVGARMAIAANGATAGLISGGCLENDLRERSAAVVSSGNPLLLAYDSTSPADIVWGMGLGCAGKVYVLVERITAGERCDTVEFIRQLTKCNSGGVIATVYLVTGSPGVQVGSRAFLLDNCWSSGSIAHPLVATRLHRACLAAFAGRGSSNAVIEVPEGTAEVLVEYLPPPVPLFIFGAGPDAIPLVRLAKGLGWRVTLVDGRSAFLSRESFSEADDLLLADAEEVPEKVHPPPQAVAVVMTHSLSRDSAIVKHLLPLPFAYIGILGPKARGDLVLDGLRDAGCVFSDEFRARLFFPVGLDLGAETPDEIALAVVAEIQAVLHHRLGGFLRSRNGPIHT